jgi:hypothetical protein
MTKTGRLIHILLLLLLFVAPLLGQSSPQQQPQPPAPPAPTDVPGLGVQVESQPQAPPAKAQQPPSANPQYKMSPAEAQDLFRSVDEILKFVSEDTGLPIKHPVKRALASREQVQKYVEDRMKDDEDAKRFEQSEMVMKKLRLLPADFDLRSFLVQLLKEQVAGYYDAKTKTVYLLDWVEPEAQKPVLAHELTHALQDQNFDLQKWTKAARGKDDIEGDERIAARQAVTEGQGMVVLVDYMLRSTGQTIRTSPMLADAISRSMISNAGTPILGRAPQYIKDVLLFPYQYGVSFERDLLVKDGIQGAFAGAMQNPPQDTHEIMQPQAYLDGQRVPPLRPLDLAKVVGKKYSKYDLGILGEFDIESLLDQFAGQGAAQTVSPNWRGGYYYAFVPAKAPPKTMPLLAYISRWSSVDAASEFAAAYSKAVWKRYQQTEIVKGQQAKVGDDGKVRYPERLTQPVTWKTEEGPVIIEPHGAMVLVTEGFDEATQVKISGAVFSQTAAFMFPVSYAADLTPLWQQLIVGR